MEEDRGRVLRLTSLSFAHPVVHSDRRARLFLSEKAIDEAHRRLRSIGHHAFLLSTCLRVEIAWAAGPELGPDILNCLYGRHSLTDEAAIRSDETAFVHLSRVAAGLESPLVGETEVLAQFRQAVSVMPEASPAPGDLAKVLDAAVGIGRTTRRLLGDTPRGSLGALAANAAAASRSVAILGAGAMARAAAEHLGGVEVTVFARRPGEVGGHATRPWEQGADALATSSVVISTVPGNGPLFSGDVIARAFGSRTEPLLLIDLGMPPGFDRPEADGVRYLGVDEVASSVSARPSIEVEDRIFGAASAVWRRLSAPDRVGAVIAAMIEQADTAVSEEVLRFANRLSVTGDPERILRQLAHSVARRVLHGPIAYVSSSEHGAEVAESLAEAFGIADSSGTGND